MRRGIIALALLLSAAVSANAQETYTARNADRDFIRGKELYVEGKYGASKAYLTKYIGENGDKDTPQLQFARYYLACNSFYLKDKDAPEILTAYLDDYPYSPMRGRVCYMIGRLCYEKKDYEKALQWYSQVGKNTLNQEENEEYQFSKGYANMMTGQYRSASPIFEALSGSGKYGDDATYYHAYSEFRLKDYDDALVQFARVDTTGRYGEAARYHILQIYDRTGQKDLAVIYGEQLIARYPQSAYISEAYRILGENSYYKGDWPSAARYLQSYAAAEEKVQRADMFMLGLSLYRQGLYADAVKALGKVTSGQDSLAQEAYMYIGYSDLRNNNISNARMAFQSAVKNASNPGLTETASYNYAMATYQDNAPFGETLTAFENFTANYPSSKHLDAVYRHMASIYMNEKDYASALRSIEKIETPNAQIRQAKENALFQLGVSAFLNNDYSGAEDYFSRSIAEYTPGSFSAQAFLWRGETYYRLGKQDLCRKDIMAFLNKTQPKDVNDVLKAYYTLGYSYFEARDYDAAMNWFSKFLTIKNADRNKLYPDVLNRVGDYYFNRRDFNRALETYAKVNPGSAAAPYATYQYAFILGLQKRYDEKIASLNKLISKYKDSDYADIAIYELGRTYFIMERYDKAVDTYRVLVDKGGKNQLTRKAALEIGMVYANMNEADKAIGAYKNVVEKYPNSEETKVALESMQVIYIEQNRVDDYLAYRESIAGSAISTIARSEEDSITFIAAERVYAKGDYRTAIASLNNYIVKFCDIPTLNCITAQYYIAECYYALQEYDSALPFYEKLSTYDGNSYMDKALIRASEITYDKKNYTDAAYYFRQLLQTADSKEEKATARLGILRCSYYTDDYRSAVDIATEIMATDTADNALMREARYCRAKSYWALGAKDSAATDLTALSTDVRHEMGAEATYMYAAYLTEKGDYDEAEKVIMKFIQENTPHQYWLAKCFVLLFDIYIAKGDDFMAKQYLISLQENYPDTTNDIRPLINERLDSIQSREEATILQ